MFPCVSGMILASYNTNGSFVHERFFCPNFCWMLMDALIPWSFKREGMFMTASWHDFFGALKGYLNHFENLSHWEKQKPILKTGAIVSDVGSTKVQICAAAQKAGSKMNCNKMNEPKSYPYNTIDPGLSAKS